MSAPRSQCNPLEEIHDDGARRTLSDPSWCSQHFCLMPIQAAAVFGSESKSEAELREVLSLESTSMSISSIRWSELCHLVVRVLVVGRSSLPISFGAESVFSGLQCMTRQDP